MAYRTLQLAQENGVALITLNRPERRNAITYQLIDELLDALDRLARSDSLVLILTGAGQAFCSGMDLEELRHITARTLTDNLSDSSTMARLFRTLYEFPRPTIAAVNGAAVAGGCGLATLCDLTVASSEAKFGYPEGRIGFMPAIVSVFLLRQIGEKQARDLLLTGRILGASEALRMGLVSEVVAPAEVMPRARQLAATLMENSPASVTATKRLLSSFAAEALEKQIARAVEENARIRAGEDFREGVTAFLEKRKPEWSRG